MNNILVRCPVCRNEMHSHADLIEKKKVKITCDKCQITLKDALVNIKTKEEKIINVKEIA